MPELYKGFIPFAYVETDAEYGDTIYDDEVGNDYDPRGWNTALVMKNRKCTVTANDGKDTIDVIHAKINDDFNKDGFKSGIWNKIKDGCEGTATKPVIDDITFSVQDDIIDVDGKDPKDLTTTVSIESGKDPMKSLTFEVFANGVSIMTETVDNPQTGKYPLVIDAETMGMIEQADASNLTVKVTVSDGTNEVTSEKTLQLAHRVQFGVINTNDINLAPAIIKNLTDRERIQTLLNPYTEKTFTLSPFLPTGDWAYMFIAVPANFGKIRRIYNGAEYEIGPDEWSPTTCTMNDIDYNLYVMQYNNEGTFEFLITVE